jgi:hypothetical protein
VGAQEDLSEPQGRPSCSHHGLVVMSVQTGPHKQNRTSQACDGYPGVGVLVIL